MFSFMHSGFLKTDENLICFEVNSTIHFLESSYSLIINVNFICYYCAKALEFDHIFQPSSVIYNVFCL
jgi:hypothetical protein